MKYVAFLLGINLGKRTVKMADLIKCFEMLSYGNVQTLLASGNVIFETETKPDNETLEQHLEKTFGFPIKIILLPYDEIQKLVRGNPFEHIKTNSDSRFYITFFAHEINQTHMSSTNGVEIIVIPPHYIAWAVQLKPGSGTTEGMKIINKTFGKENTTRNWNTIMKLAAA